MVCNHFKHGPNNVKGCYGGFDRNHVGMDGVRLLLGSTTGEAEVGDSMAGGALGPQSWARILGSLHRKGALNQTA